MSFSCIGVAHSKVSNPAVGCAWDSVAGRGLGVTNEQERERSGREGWLWGPNGRREDL